MDIFTKQTIMEFEATRNRMRSIKQLHGVLIQKLYGVSILDASTTNNAKDLVKSWTTSSQSSKAQSFGANQTTKLCATSATIRNDNRSDMDEQEQIEEQEELEQVIVELKPNDLIVLMSPHRMGDAYAAAVVSSIEEQLKAAGLENKVLLIDDGLKLRILRKESLSQQIDELIEERGKGGQLF